MVSVQDARDHLGFSKQANYLYKFVTERLGGKTAIVEDRYIDKDFFVDYAGFYARSFGNINRCTTRIHFFSETFDEYFLKNSLMDYHEDKLNKNSYLGFTVIKQFKDGSGKPDPLVGRTLIPPTKPQDESSDNSRYICNEYKASLYGIPLTVSSLPFQAQDGAIAACATTALWTASHQLKTLFGTPALPPIEITRRAGYTIEDNRNLPNYNGLTLKQMLTYIRSLDLDFEYINLNEMRCRYDYEVKNMVPETIKAMFALKIPLIAVLELKEDTLPPDHHAVVITGYEQNKSRIDRIYVHDDQIGPYSEVEDESDDGSFLNWSNGWKESVDEVQLHGLIIPLYHKIRLSYGEIMKYFLNLKNEYPGMNLNLYITTVQEYKNKVLNQNIRDKIDILRKPMPKYMWVINFKYNNSDIMDFLIDATSHIIRIRQVIIYK